MANLQNSISSPASCVLSRGRLALLFLGLCVLTANAMADVSFDGKNLTGDGVYSSNITAAGDLISRATDQNSTITLRNNTITAAGEYYHDLGNIVFENGTTTTLANFNIRGDNTTTPAVTIDGTFTCNNFVIGKVYNSGPTKGVLYITENANVTAKGYSPLGNTSNAQGTVNQSGGSITFTNEVTQQSDDFILRFGAQPSSTGTYNLSGGTLTCVNAKLCVGYQTNATGTLNITGGTANFKGIKIANSSGTKGTLNLYGGELKIAGDGVTKGSGTATINLGQGTVSALANHTWASGLTINLNGRSATSESDVAGGVTTFSVDAGKSITIGSVIAGVGALTKTGTGSLTIAADANGQPYTGGTTVSAGTLYLKGTNNGKSSVGTGNLTISSGAIVEAQSANVLGHTSASNMPHVIINGGTLKPRQYLHMKSVDLNGGTITASTVSGGTGLDFNNRNGVITSTGASSIASPIVNTSTLTINVKSGTLSLTSTINNTVGSTNKTIKTGSGTLTTSSWINNIIELQEGTLEITDNFGGNGKRFNGEITIAKGAKLECATKDSLGYGSANTKINIYGVMDSTKDNETLNNTELHMYGGTAQASSGSTFDILNTGVKFFSYALDDATAEKFTVSTISPTIIFRTNGTFAIDTEENSQLNLTGSIQNLYNNTRYNCTIAKTGKGTLVLSGANEHTNPTTVSAGVLQLTGDAVVANGSVSIGENGTLEYNIAEGQTKMLAVGANNKISGTGKITKTGDGTLQINATQGSVDAQSLVVSSGRLDMKTYFTGALEIGKSLGDDNFTTATFSPGNSVGTLNINGDFTLNPGSTLLLEFDETGADSLIVSGTTTFAEGSFITLALDDGASVSPNQQISFQLSPNIATFDNAALSYPSYLTGVSYNPTTGVLSATVDANAVPEPSTWALLVLGVAALFLRKRVRS